MVGVSMVTGPGKRPEPWRAELGEPLKRQVGSDSLKVLGFSSVLLGPLRL